MSSLVIGGCIFLLISLALAWLATALRIFNVKSLKKIFPNSANIVRAHIDYLLMALLLFAFYALAVELPGWLIALMLIGAAINPFLFILFATKKPEEMKPGPVFLGIALLSFISTTIGFGGAAILVALDALA